MDNYKDQLISFETAKLAKKKGFSVHCGHYYTKDGEVHEDSIKRVTIGDVCCEAPTQTLLQKWLREKHQIYMYTYYNCAENADCSVVYTETLTKKTIIKSNYEEANEAGLIEALNII